MVLLVTPWLLKSYGRLNRCRAPDLHHHNESAVCRFGGLSLAAAYVGIECFVAFFASEAGEWTLNRVVVLIAPLAIFVLGFWDDLSPVGPRKKLIGQVLIALAVAKSGVGIACLKMPVLEGVIGAEALETILTVAWLVTCTNITNLVDGVDGLAGSIGLILLAVMVCLSQGALAWLTTGMTCALLAFLWYNLPPARIYLGDGGAYLLGFQLGLFSIVAAQARTDAAPLLLPLFGLALPMLDTLLVVARRGLRGLPVFRPDRDHLHHYLLETGMSPFRIVMWYSGFTLLFLLLGAVFMFWPRSSFVPVSLGVVLVLTLALYKLKPTFSGWRKFLGSLSTSMAMRQEIAYALCLRTWLRHEAERCSSVEELYADLRLAARRLGFTSVRLALADGYRTWKQPCVCGPLLSTCHSLQGGALGVLELEAPRCRLSLSPATPRSGPRAKCGSSCRPLLINAGLIKILSDLLAESWVEATRDWNLGKVRLRFDQELPRNWGVVRRGKAGKVNSGSTQVKCPEPKENGLLAARTAGFLRRTCGFALSAVLLSASGAIGSESQDSAALQEAFTRIPRVEQPAKAATLVRSSKLSVRPLVTGTVIKAVAKESPAVVTAVVGAIAKTVPEMAATAAGAAALEQPGQAAAIAKAAAAAAPTQTRAIVLAVCRAVPGDYRNIALCVERIVPGSNKEILEALAVVFPELRGVLGTNLPPFAPSSSVSAVLDSPAVQVRPKPAFIGPGVSTLGGNPLVRGPTIGPPFVPLSGTVTNVTPSTSGTVPTGGRNYATP
jgi:UDP-GlcNAc:undecaprenyl-phosphate GlcNAc-1-phosphate transferase